MPSRLRAVAIIRMSTDQQQFSPDRQRSMFAEYCQRWDLEAVGEYADEGVSATHTTLSRRAGLMQLVEDAKAGGFRLAWCEMADRIARKGWEFGLVRELLLAHGVAIVRDRDNPHEAADDADREFLQDLDVVLARREIRKTSARVRSAQRRRLAQGLYIGGLLPAGLAWEWQDDAHTAGRYVVDPEGQRLVVRVMELYAQTGSTMATAQALNDEGLPSVTGRKWLQSAVYHMVGNPVYRGVRRYGNERFELQLPEVVSPELMARVDARLAQVRSRPRRAASSRTRHALFAGLLRCPECGAWLGCCSATNPRGTLYYSYKCRNAYFPPKACSWRHTIPQLSLERAVLPLFVAHLQTIGVSQPTHRPRPQQDKSHRREQLEAERQRVVAMHVRGRLTETEADRLLDDVAERLAELDAEPEQRRPALREVRRLLEVLETAWPHLPIADRRHLLQSWIDHIIPVPGRHNLHRSEIAFRW